MKSNETSFPLQCRKPLQLLKLYLNVNYYLPISPFNVSFDITEGKLRCRLVSGLSRVGPSRPYFEFPLRSISLVK